MTDPSAVHYRHARQLAQERVPNLQPRTTPQAIASVEDAPSSAHLAAAPSRAVIIGGSVAGIFTAAVTAPFFDEVIHFCAYLSSDQLLMLIFVASTGIA